MSEIKTLDENLGKLLTAFGDVSQEDPSDRAVQIAGKVIKVTPVQYEGKEASVVTLDVDAGSQEGNKFTFLTAEKVSVDEVLVLPVYDSAEDPDFGKVYRAGTIVKDTFTPDAP